MTTSASAILNDCIVIARDISPEAFNGKPVCLDLGTHIVECVKVATSPSDRSDPAWALEDSELLIGPDLFGMRQRTVLSLPIDGEPPQGSGVFRECPHLS
jgi:hypothetical protein